MSAIFLSSSVPVAGRGNYYESADPFLIQSAVREFVAAALGRRLIVWGGHPAITPMVWAVCEDLGVKFSNAVVLYQSRFFADIFPEENKRFGNVEYVDAVPHDREASLRRMREAMLSRKDLAAAVFIGGMEGILEEHTMFRQFHPEAQVLAVPAPGGAARQLAERLGAATNVDLKTLDFARLFHVALNIAPDASRTREGHMAKKRVFISFDFENDKTLRDFMIGQAKLEDSPFEVTDQSLKEAAPEKDWLTKAKAAIARSEVFIVMLGPKTKTASGVLKEVKVANELNKTKFQLIGYKDGTEALALPDAGRVYRWNWENLKKLLA